MASEDSILKNLNLGSSKESIKGSPSSPLAQLITVEAQEIVDRLRKSAYKYDVDASGQLIQETNPTKVSVSGSEVTIGISAPFYWKFVNFGINGSLVNRGAPTWGKQPPSGFTMSQALSAWSRDRGIRAVDGRSNWISRSHVAGMSLTERGQIARPFYSDVVNDALMKELEEPIMKLMGKAITIKIVDPWQ
jgi:hypothetical protein